MPNTSIYRIVTRAYQLAHGSNARIEDDNNFPHHLSRAHTSLADDQMIQQQQALAILTNHPGLYEQLNEADKKNIFLDYLFIIMSFRKKNEDIRDAIVNPPNATSVLTYTQLLMFMLSHKEDFAPWLALINNDQALELTSVITKLKNQHGIDITKRYEAVTHKLFNQLILAIQQQRGSHPPNITALFNEFTQKYHANTLFYSINRHYLFLFIKSIDTVWPSAMAQLIAQLPTNIIQNELTTLIQSGQLSGSAVYHCFLALIETQPEQLGVVLEKTHAALPKGVILDLLKSELEKYNQYDQDKADNKADSRSIKHIISLFKCLSFEKQLSVSQTLIANASERLILYMMLIHAQNWPPEQKTQFALTLIDSTPSKAHLLLENPTMKAHILGDMHLSLKCYMAVGAKQWIKLITQEERIACSLQFFKAKSKETAILQRSFSMHYTHHIAQTKNTEDKQLETFQNALTKLASHYSPSLFSNLGNNIGTHFICALMLIAGQEGFAHEKVKSQNMQSLMDSPLLPICIR